MSNNVAKIAKATNSFSTLSVQLNEAFLERQYEISLLLTGMVAEMPLVFLGQPGTGKSSLVNTFFRSFESVADTDAGERHSIKDTLGKFTTPAKLLGTVSIKRWQEDDMYVNNPKGKMPLANNVFLDEVFKCNPACLNSLLTLINEGEYEIGDGITRQSRCEFFVGASNELPEEGQGLEALWDRFCLRVWVDDIKHEENFISLITAGGGKNDNLSPVTHVVSREELTTLRELAANVDISGVIGTFCKVRQDMAELQIRVSDRKWRKCVTAVKAVSALKGRSKAKPADLGVLAAMLWETPDQADAIQKMLAKLATGDSAEAMRLQDSAKGIEENVKGFAKQVKNGDKPRVWMLKSAKREALEIKAMLGDLDQDEDEVQRGLQYVDQLLNTISAVISEVLG